MITAHVIERFRIERLDKGEDAAVTHHELMAILRMAGVVAFTGNAAAAGVQDEAKAAENIDDKAIERLRHTMVEIDRPGTVGCLTPYGAGCVLDALRLAGFKVVRA